MNSVKFREPYFHALWCVPVTEYDTSISMGQIGFIMGCALGIIFIVSYVVFECDRTHNTDEWSYGIQKDSVNFIFHHPWCIMCCKTKFVMTKSELIKQELEIRLERYDRGLAEEQEK